jgi:hypothetical protein
VGGKWGLLTGSGSGRNRAVAMVGLAGCCAFAILFAVEISRIVSGLCSAV